MNYDQYVITYFDIAKLVANRELICYLSYESSGEISEVAIGPGYFALKVVTNSEFDEAIFSLDCLGSKNGTKIFLEEKNIIAIKRPVSKKYYKIIVCQRHQKEVDVLNWLQRA